MFSLQGKKALITGAGSGIGRAIATLFARQGAAVHILELTEGSGAETAADIAAFGGQAWVHAADVSDAAAVQQLVQALGAIDILVNNAGIAHIGAAHSTSETDFEKVLAVNVRGVYHCLHAVLPGMMQQRSGVVLNMSSIAAIVGLNDRFAYSMSKGAVLAMTLSVAKDYLAYGIRCNCISPARVHTPFVDGFLARNYPGNETEMFDRLSASQPIGRMGTPQEVAQLALYLCSDEASFITGSDYPIDGGFIRLNT